LDLILIQGRNNMMYSKKMYIILFGILHAWFFVPMHACYFDNEDLQSPLYQSLLGSYYCSKNLSTISEVYESDECEEEVGPSSCNPSYDLNSFNQMSSSDVKNTFDSFLETKKMLPPVGGLLGAKIEIVAREAQQWLNEFNAMSLENQKREWREIQSALQDIDCIIKFGSDEEFAEVLALSDSFKALAPKYDDRDLDC